MIELYSKSYSRLISRAKNYSKEEEPEDEEPPEKTAPPERQVINLAQDSAPNNSSDWSKYFETSMYEDEPKKKIKNDNNSRPTETTSNSLFSILNEIRNEYKTKFPNLNQSDLQRKLLKGIKI